MTAHRPGWPRWAAALIAAAAPCVAAGGPASRMHPPDGAEMIEIPAGEFLMGTAADARHVWDGETPQRRVHLDGYWIYRHPVTVAQFRRFAEATGTAFDWAGREPSWGWRDDHPMVRVSWSEANAYAVWVGLSLPTEAQWEKAARGADGRVYPWGDRWDPLRCNNVLTGPHATTPVGAWPAGASPYGVEDLAGNVEEWCLEAYDPGYHQATPAVNPVGPLAGALRVVRGGSWLYSGEDWNFRAAARYRFPAGAWFHYYGFRSATPAPGVEPALRAPAPAPEIPDLLRGADGARVETAAAWRERRRPELLEAFRAHVYGRRPAERPAGLAFTLLEADRGAMGGRATRKRVAVDYRGPGGAGRMELLLFVPAAARGPAPAFLLIGHRDALNMDPSRTVRTPFWPAEDIVERGYAAVAFDARQVAADRPDGLAGGVFAAFGPFGGERPPDAWGTLAAWAWGASRALDYLETDPDVDAARVAVVGHSRGGKAALWAAAEDERFALAVSNGSGTGGAAMTREKRWGGIAEQIRHHPYWYAARYADYAGREEALPVDQHGLLALIAPRRVYVASGTLDAGADPESEFRSCVEAGPVFRLLGGAGLGAAVMPRPDRSLHRGGIGYHVRTGGHDLTRADWGRFMDYADRWWRGAGGEGD